MTMAKLAEIVGVSVSTVSKAFSGSKEISEKKRELIFEAAKKYGCYDKYRKSNYTDKVIAVICPEFKGRYYTEHLAVFEQEIRKHNAVMIACVTDFDKKKEHELITFFSEYSKVDGIIIFDMTDNNQKYSLPIVSIGNSNCNSNVNSIKISMNKAIDEAVAHLIEYGHSDIAFLGEKNTESSMEIFKAVMKKHNCKINDTFILTSNSRFEEAGYENMNRLFESGHIPTAIVAAYDYIAIGAMKSIYEHGLRIPEDISIIGTNDIKENPYLKVPLTSITTYIEDSCQIAVDILFEKLSAYNLSKVQTVCVSADLIKRNTVGPVRNK